MRINPDEMVAAAAAWQAIVEACVITEAVTPDVADPRGTLDRLIDYHVALDKDLTTRMHFPALLDWCKDAEAVLQKMAADGWVSDVLQAESREGLYKALMALKREARGVFGQSGIGNMARIINAMAWCGGHGEPSCPGGHDLARMIRSKCCEAKSKV